MDFIITCLVHSQNRELPEMETLHFVDGCVHYLDNEIRYLSKYFTVISFYQKNVQSVYINRVTHVKKFITILYIDFLKEKDYRDYTTHQETQPEIDTSDFRSKTKIKKNYRYNFYAIHPELEKNMLKLIEEQRLQFDELLDELVQ